MMRFFHLSDLHIGKQLGLYDLSDLQRRTLHQIVKAVQTYQPDAVLIAGDIYDKAAPSGEAFRIFDDFLKDLSEIHPQVPVLIISGNHDSGRRLGYAGSFLERAGITVAAMPPQTQEEHLKKVTLTDEYGPVHFYLLPFVKPADAKNLFREDPSVSITSYEDAFRAILDREEIDPSARNVLAAHQFVTAGKEQEPITCESELSYVSLGGIDRIAAAAAEAFDYTALGHLHTAQNIGSARVRYCGTMLKYSAGEAKDKKSITMVTLGEKGSEPVITEIPLEQTPDVRKIRGTLAELLASREGDPEDYLSIVLTDEEPQFRVRDRLAEKYPHILDFSIDNKRTAAMLTETEEDETEEDPFLLFEDFYQEMNGQPLSEEGRRVLTEVMQKVLEAGWEGGNEA